MAKTVSVALVVVFAALVISCTADLPSPQSPQSLEHRYRLWLDDGHRTDVLRYGASLQVDGTRDVVPMPALLRTSRRWRLCRHDEFSIPPAGLWRNMPPTLRVVAQLRDAGILQPALARSAYRDAGINRCAGGSAGSRHLENRAIDFDLPSSPDNVARLCAFWREQGPALNLGLGFYSPTAIHLDTAGFRTWGDDHHRATSLCITAQSSSHPP